MQIFLIEVKNRIYYEKSKFSSNIEIFFKNLNLLQKSIFFVKIEIGKHRNKIELFLKNRYFCEKSKFL